ncbi:MAG: 2-oxoglutarate dehydrogenase, E2 component, dihydrolipoamide succinyltransferase [Actinomycetaceae bacterium]|nr:2-oxoglutarate dehydrogenase, E2 component, dihydrolipoamide succinyltransferase [Actinomycetaceae bacterium]
MAEAVKMPALGESVTEGTVTEWLKQVGDTVEVDEPIVEVSTDKVDSEVPSPFAGVITQILVEEDETVEVGTVLALIGDEGEGDSGDAPAAEEAPAAEPAPVQEAPAPAQEAPAAPAGGAGGETIEVTMPALGESVTEGTVTEWLKAVGDKVEADEPLLEVSTDKVDSEVPSPADGFLAEIKVEEDETVEVGTVIAVISTGEPGSAPAPAPAQEEPAPAPAQEAPAAPAAEAPAPAAPAEEAPAADAGGETVEVRMPALGESVTEGTVTEWLKAVGDKVEEDEALLEVSTDKVDSEVPSPVSGYLAEIKVEEDETVDVDTVIALISTGKPGASAPVAPKEEPAPAPKEEPKAEAPAAPAAPVQPSVAAEPTSPKPEAPKPAAAKAPAAAAGTYVTPIVRKLAKEQGVDLSEVEGTGIGGRIRKEDVLEAAKKAEEARKAAEAEAQKAAAPAPAAPAAKPASKIEPDTTLRGTTQKMTRMRQVIADRMRSSLQEAAQLTTVVEVDVTRVAAIRGRAKVPFQQREGTKLTFLPFFVKAATEALKAHPKLNAQIKGKEVEYFDYENIGIAVDTERGLMVPVIKNAGDLTISGIAKSINDLAARTRDNKIKPEELSGGTFTITNTGSGGALFDTPVLNAPQVAILGVGTIVKRPMVVKDAEGNETIGIRSMVYLSLTYDHQLIDGADASRYLMTVKQRLEEGEFEAEVGL